MQHCEHKELRLHFMVIECMSDYWTHMWPMPFRLLIHAWLTRDRFQRYCRRPAIVEANEWSRVKLEEFTFYVFV